MWDFNSGSLWDALLWMFFFFIWIAFIFIWVRCVMDLFSDRETGGFAKTLWTICFIFFAPLTTLVYLIARGKGMSERQVARAAQAQQATDTYIREVAGSSASDEIAKAKQLLDSGVISADEFAAIKAKALASL